ncbi:MAG: flagellar basal body P-ring formation chaperone FlgA [Rhodospirillales bacterium]
MRTFLIILGVAAVIFAAIPTSTATAAGSSRQASDQDALVGSPVALRPSAIVDGELILLGDLFENTGDLATEPVAYAPDPGRQATYGAQWLYQIARHFRLDWRPMSTRDVTVIERASQVVTREEIEQELLVAIGDQSTGGDLSVQLSNRTLELHLPVTSRGGIEVADLDYDVVSGRMTAIIVAPAGDPLAQRIRVSGVVLQVMEIPVMTRHVARGELISERDIEWRRVDANKVPRDAVTSLDELVGMAPRRGLRVGSAVRLSEIEAPELVARHSLVTISIEYPMMRLTAQGKALDAGALGEVIRVQNTRSKKLVEATVTGPGQALVQASTLVAMN